MRNKTQTMREYVSGGVHAAAINYKEKENI
jgi:hypothetical protein